MGINEPHSVSDGEGFRADQAIIAGLRKYLTERGYNDIDEAIPFSRPVDLTGIQLEDAQSLLDWLEPEEIRQILSMMWINEPTSVSDKESFSTEKEILKFDARVDPEIPHGLHRVIKQKELRFSGIDDLWAEELKKVLHLAEWLQEDVKMKVLNIYYATHGAPQ